MRAPCVAEGTGSNYRAPRAMSCLFRRALAGLIALALSSGLMANAGHAATGQKIGVFYLLWHCPASSSPRYNPAGAIYDNSKILAGAGAWGPIHALHWWGKPDAGYYCLAESDDLLGQHAEMLRDAGIDFVFVDITNQPDQAGSGPMIIDPFNAMMRVWSRVPGAPKIVPWVPITGNGDMVDYFDQMMTEHPEMAFEYQGKPLLLAVGPKSDRGSAQFKHLQARYTIRLMWGLLNADQLHSAEWSFLQPCVESFKERGGDEECGQGVSYQSGVMEQIPVTAAYQLSYMSDTTSAVPKFHGKTLLRQLETAYQHPDVPIVTITGWNEWIAQRFCHDNQAASACDGNDNFANGNKVFVDQYDAEYNRDLEPGGGFGDYYYRLMKHAIDLLRAGKNPIAVPVRTERP
jgi:hypothetical protein